MKNFYLLHNLDTELAGYYESQNTHLLLQRMVGTNVGCRSEQLSEKMKTGQWCSYQNDDVTLQG